MAVLLVGNASISLASERELEELLLRCSKVENDAKRLACFDELVPSNAGQPTAENIELQGTQEPIAEKSSDKDSKGDELGQKYLEKPQESKPKTSRSYNLIAVYQDNKERWNFKFDNGEVWQQIEPRYLPKLENFPVQVDISEGVFGSHNLRAEDFGKVVKVKRLK